MMTSWHILCLKNHAAAALVVVRPGAPSNMLAVAAMLQGKQPWDLNHPPDVGRQQRFAVACRVQRYSESDESPCLNPKRD